uniref:2-dehydropantoate 2-reductase n=1 Tax=Burkholderia sp. (strain CCGE1003) TaxID=640512 RepID=E1T9P4_BURSG
MRILVLGAGALGGYYGAQLLQAGGDVTFLVRPRRRELLRANGLAVKSVFGAIQSKVEAVLAGDIEPLYDIVLLTCKAYDLDTAIASIAPAVGCNSVVLPLLNGFSAYDALDRRFGRHRVLGGVAYIATKLLPNGDIAHLSPFDKLIIGARDPIHAVTARSIYEVFSRTPGDRTLSERIEAQLWEKWVMVCAGAAATCLMRSTIGHIMRTANGEQLIRALISECQQIARKSGFALDDVAVRSIEGSLLDPNSTWAASMMRDIESGARQVEADAIVGDMIERARQHSISTPYLDVAYSHLQAYALQRAAS